MAFLDDLQALAVAAQKERDEVTSADQELVAAQAAALDAKSQADAAQKAVEDGVKAVQKEKNEAIVSLNAILARVQEEIATLQQA